MNVDSNVLRRVVEMRHESLERCHAGVRVLACRWAIEQNESAVGIQFGRGTLTLDGVAHPVAAGDASLVKRGHTHGLENTSDAPLRLLVVGVRPTPAGTYLPDAP